MKLFDEAMLKCAPEVQELLKETTVEVVEPWKGSETLQLRLEDSARSRSYTKVALAEASAAPAEASAAPEGEPEAKPEGEPEAKPEGEPAPEPEPKPEGEPAAAPAAEPAAAPAAEPAEYSAVTFSNANPAILQGIGTIYGKQAGKRPFSMGFRPKALKPLEISRNRMRKCHS